MTFAEHLKDMMLAIAAEDDIPVDAAGDNIIVCYDDFNECVVAATSAGDAVEFRAPLFAFAAENRDKLFEEALKLNLDSGADGAVALSDDAPVLLLCHRVAAEGLHQRELREALVDFIETTQSARERLASVRGDAPLHADDALPDLDLIILRP
jgi:hypothetical protein